MLSLLPIVAVLTAVITLSSVFVWVSAYDAPETVDTGAERILLSGPPQIYKFGNPVMKNSTYSDGSVVPSVTMSIERFNQTTNQWETIGYTNTHLHKLKIDPSDKEDLSVGHTDRFNPKNIGPD